MKISSVQHLLNHKILFLFEPLKKGSFIHFIKSPQAIFCLGVFFFMLFWQLSQGEIHTKDSEEYLFAAENILHHQTLYSGDLSLPIDYRLFSKRPPLYPLVLLISGFTPLLLFLIQIIAGMLSIYLALRSVEMIREKELSDQQKWLFTFLLVLHPAQWIYASTIMSDIWLQLSWTAFVFFLVQVLKYKRNHQIKWLVLSALAGMMFKPVMAATVFLLPLLLFFKGLHNRYNAMWLFLPLLFFTGFSMRNLSQSGVFEYSSIGSINLIQYNCRYLLNKTHKPEQADSLLEQYMYIPHDRDAYQRWSKESKAAGLQMITENPLKYGFIHLGGMIRMLIDPGRFELMLFLGKPYTEGEDGFLKSLQKGGVLQAKKALVNSPLAWVLLLLLLVNSLELLLFTKSIIHYRKNTLFWLALIPFILIVFLTGPIGASRFMLPLVPIYCAFIAGSLLNR